MAMVDFTNARLELASTNPSIPSVGKTYLNLNNAILRDSNGIQICSNASTSILINEQYKFVIRFAGKFTASGTEFYICDTASIATPRWKMSNISFNNGDTYVFQITANLTCN